MGPYIKGDLVLVMFPFSNLKGTAKRPAIVLHDLPGDDIILCQVTSKTHGNSHEIPLNMSNLVSGAMPVTSYVLPFKIFTGCKTELKENRRGDKVLGHLKDDKLKEVIDGVVHFITK